MPKFVEQILEMLELKQEFAEIEDDPDQVWINIAFENPDFPDEETELNIL